ncbi:origin recognition complex subunit 5 [Heterostelium album PN500]|uniref:Origin recognition complex subunit 5 n=1 Tax=Heterostelium pallidum (strain ATCC 26659 / Pp 5 / PN500) TaxID=670386 RepID=D3BPZ1_HETP5|nr:origin recognition complex subunit 5 [Heterostelium album PN500]EFA76542.1 origin recognition complex subunit 5 [Heterostelium album PN500]|eukprot:XP_020428674.1 origin recognition complex subunit 5 [Heterostelium album PN500]
MNSFENIFSFLEQISKIDVNSFYKKEKDSTKINIDKLLDVIQEHQFIFDDDPHLQKTLEDDAENPEKSTLDKIVDIIRKFAPKEITLQDGMTVAEILGTYLQTKKTIMMSISTLVVVANILVVYKLSQDQKTEDKELNGYQEEVKELQNRTEEYIKEYLQIPSTDIERDRLILRLSNTINRLHTIRLRLLQMKQRSIITIKSLVVLGVASVALSAYSIWGTPLKYVGSLYVWGPSHSGKLSTLLQVLTDHNAVYSQIDAKTNYDKTTLFQNLLSNLTIPINNVNNNNDNSSNHLLEADLISLHYRYKQNSLRFNITQSNCPTLVELCDHLVEKLRYTLKQQQQQQQQQSQNNNIQEDNNDKQKQLPIIYIIIDCADCLERSILQMLLKIQEYSQHRISVILISELPIEKVIPIQLIPGSRSPLTIHFPQYTQDELSTIIKYLSKNERNIDLVLYNRLTEIALETLYQQIRDLAHLLHILKILYPKYIEPLEYGVERDDNIQLYNSIQPTITSIINNIYKQTQNDIVDATQLAIQHDISMKELGFSFNTKCLLITGFLASTFSKTKDKLLYTKENVKRDPN